MEIVLDNLNNIKDEFSKLQTKDWLKIINTHLNIGVVVTRKVDKLPFPMIYDDIGTIFFEAKDYPDFYEGYDGTDFNLEYLDYYLELLLSQTDLKYFKYIRLLMSKGLRVGDIITFENGRRGKILPPSETCICNIRYRLIKKDGSLGSKELMLYGNTNFSVEN